MHMFWQYSHDAKQRQEAAERKENGVSAIAQIDLFTRLETLQKLKESRVLFCLLFLVPTSPHAPSSSSQLTKDIRASN